MQSSQTERPEAAGPSGASPRSAYLELAADGSVVALSTAAERLLGTRLEAGRWAQPSDYLLDPTGRPIGPALLNALIHNPDMAALRRDGLPLLVPAAEVGRLAVRVTVADGAQPGTARLHLHPGATYEPWQVQPERPLQAAARARRVLLRRSPGEVPVSAFCQALVEAGYPGAAVYGAEVAGDATAEPLGWVRGQGEPGPAGGHPDRALAEAARVGRPVSGQCVPPWLDHSESAPAARPCLVLPVTAAGNGPVLVVFHEAPDAMDVPEWEILRELAADLGQVLAPESGQASEEPAADLSGILEAAPDFLAMLDREGRLRFLNGGGLRLLGGIERGDCYGRGFAEFQPRAAGRRFREEALPTALEQGSWRGETTLLTAQGAEIPVDQTLVARSGGEGGADALFTIVRDVSDRKQEEARLRDSEEKYRRILEAAQEGFWIVHDQLQGDDHPQLRYKVPVSKGSRIVLVDLPEVRFFQADGHYTQVYTGGDQLLCNLSVSDLERRLDATQFVRIHRSYIINLQFIHVLERVDDQWVVTIGTHNGERLPVSRRNVEKLKVMLGVS